MREQVYKPIVCPQCHAKHPKDVRLLRTDPEQHTREYKCKVDGTLFTVREVCPVCAKLGCECS